MTNSLEYIDNYFKGVATASERADFESKLQSDEKFGKEVLFYVQAQLVAKQSALNKRSADFEQIRKVQKQHTSIFGVNRDTIKAAAAVVLLIGGGALWLSGTPTTVEVADSYLKDENGAKYLSINMNTDSGIFQHGVTAYNQQKYLEASQILEKVKSDNITNQVLLLECQGLAYLQLGRYDEAIRRFQQLALTPAIVKNNGVFYEALTRLKRNIGQDHAQAFGLLEKVVEDDLGHKKTAAEWIQKFK